MKLFKKQLNFLNIFILIGLIIIPILIYAATDLYFSLYKNSSTGTYYPRDPANSENLLLNQGACFTNISDNDYFIPNKTWAEWNSFFMHMPSGVSLSTGCCENGICSGAEDCSNCSTDCGTCWTCGVSNLIDSRDLQSYPTVQIGSQCWMAKNLNYGVEIAASSTVNGIGYYNMAYLPTNNSIVEKLCGFKSGDPTLGGDCASFGGSYSFDEALQYSTTAGTQGACPIGWHVPSDSDFIVLQETLLNQTYTPSGTVSYTDTAYQLKESGSVEDAFSPHWQAPNEGTNSTNFTAIPAPTAYVRPSNVAIAFYYGSAEWWSSSVVDATSTITYSMIRGSLGNRFFRDTNVPYININNLYLQNSIRCIKN